MDDFFFFFSSFVSIFKIYLSKVFIGASLFDRTFAFLKINENLKKGCVYDILT